jgi:hypothetical protein
MDFLGYELTQNQIVDLNQGPIFGVQFLSRLTTLKNWTSKIWSDVEAFKKRYWGGNIEGALKTVDLEKILSQTYLGRIFLKLYI